MSEIQRDKFDADDILKIVEIVAGLIARWKTPSDAVDWFDVKENVDDLKTEIREKMAEEKKTEN